MKKSKKEQHHPGKIPKLWDFLARLYAQHPDVFRNADLLRKEVERVWPALRDPSACPNCSENMLMYPVRFDYHKAQLLIQMAREVHENLDNGKSFTEANQVHVVSMRGSDAVRHATSQARTLGLIAKVTTVEGKHDTKKGWLITRRGWAALRNEPVPAEVMVFRNRIVEVDGAPEAPTTTLGEVMSKSGGGLYTPEEWVASATTHEGAIL